MRSTPEIANNAVEILEDGVEFEVLEEKDGWIHIEQGWVNAEFIE